MKRIGIILTLVLLLTTGLWIGYRAIAERIFKTQIETMLANAAQMGWHIQIDSIDYARSFTSIEASLTHIQASRAGISYTNPSGLIRISLFHPMTIQSTLSGTHTFNQTSILSSVVQIKAVFEKSQLAPLTFSVSDVRGPFPTIQNISLTLYQQGSAYQIEEFILKSDKSSLLLTGAVEQDKADLTATLLGWKEVLKTLQNEKLLTKQTAQTLSYAFQWMGTSHQIKVPLTYQNGMLSVAGIGIYLK